MNDPTPTPPIRPQQTMPLDAAPERPAQTMPLEAESHRPAQTMPLEAGGDHAQTLGSVPAQSSIFGSQFDAPGERPGDEIGAYTLVSKLGEGGFGAVWLAERRKPFTQRVALKIIKAGLDSRSIIARFEQERQTLAVMNHPNVARVIDGGVTPSGGPYFVMEFVKGQSITEFCDARALSNRERLSLFIQVCDAVQHAHSKGIIHRDLKPGNILVSAADGENPLVKVIDFGVAKALTQLDTDEFAKEEEGKMVGTPEYMSPEQAEAENDQIDTRSDVYSLGIILYELVSGVLPFDSGELRKKTYAEIQRTIREEAPPSLSVRLSVIKEKNASQMQRIAKGRSENFKRLLRDLRRELEWIPLKAMRREPKNRYQTAAAMAEDIRRYLDGHALEAAPRSGSYRLRKYVRRHTALVVSTAAVLVALVTGLTLAVWQWREAVEARSAAQASEQRAIEQRNAADEARVQANRAKDEALVAEAKAVKEREAADAARRRVEEEAYIANIQMGDTWLESGRLGRARERLEACPPQRRGWEWGWLDTRSDGSLAQLRMPGRSEVLVARFAPDGNRALTQSFDGAARVWDTCTGTPLAELRRGDASLEATAWSRDGRRVVTGHGDGLARVWDAATGAPVAELKGHAKPVRSVAFNDDGSRVASASDDASARLWNAASGATVAELKGHGGAVKAVIFSPDGRRVATASVDRTVRLWDAATGAEAGTLTGLQAPVTQLAWSPDGTAIAAGAIDGGARLWKADGSAGPVLQGHAGPINAIAFAPDGRTLVTASDDRTARIWNTADGSCAATLKGHEGAVIAAAFSPDGHLALTAGADGSARLWDAATGLAVGSLLGHADKVFSCEFSPDGSRVLTGSIDGSARLWETFQRQPVHEFQGHDSVVFTLASSPDGSRFVTASKDGTARVWNAVDGERLVLPMEGGAVNSARFSADGSTVLTVSADNRARLWNARTGAAVGALDGTVTSARYSPDGRGILTASPDGVARVWDAGTRRVVRELKGGAERLNAARYSTDGTRAVTAGADRVARIWDVAGGTLLRELPTHPGAVASASFSDDGHRVVTTCDDQHARVWNADNGELLADIACASKIRGAAFSRDGARVLLWSLQDPVARLYDATSATPVAELRGHTGGVTTAELSADGRRVLTTSADSTARVWDADSGAPLVALQGHAAGGISAGAFLLDGTRIATASGEGPVRVWDAVPARVRFAERQFAQQGRDANLGQAFMQEPHGVQPGTWVSDVRLAANRPNFMRSAGDAGIDPAVASALVRQALLGGRVQAAVEAARAWGVARLDTAMLNQVAWQGLTKLPPGDPSRDLDLLLACANEANARVGRRDPVLLDTLAHVQAARGERDRSMQTWKDALGLIDAQPAPKDAEAAAKRAALRASVQAALDGEREAAKSPTAPRP